MITTQFKTLIQAELTRLESLATPVERGTYGITRYGQARTRIKHLLSRKQTFRLSSFFSFL